MKFPGQRKIKHYFPVTTPKAVLESGKKPKIESHICGIDQTLVDIEAVSYTHLTLPTKRIV